MKKTLIRIAAAALTVAACGPKTPDPEGNKAKPITEINVNDLASKLASSCSFEDEYLASLEPRQRGHPSLSLDSLSLHQRLHRRLI